MKKYLFLSVIFIASFFLSCSNFASGSDSASPVNNGGLSNTITITGPVGIDGALPESVSLSDSVRQSSSQGNLANTAFPVLPATDSMVYEIKAVNTEDETEIYNATLDLESTPMTFSVGIPSDSVEGRYYKLTATAKASASAPVILSAETDPFIISVENSIVSKSLSLTAVSDASESGTVALVVTVASNTGIQSAKMIIGEDEVNASISSTTYTFEKGSISGSVVTDGVSCGAHTATFEFYSGEPDGDGNCTGSLIYSFREKLNVFANMVTDTWTKNTVSGSPWLTTTTTAGVTTSLCTISKQLTSGYGITKIYVDPSRSTVSGSANYTSGTGYIDNPCVSLNDALGKLCNAGKDYTIFIKGTLTGAQVIPSTISARTLLIKGQRPLSGGVPQDVLDGGFTESSKGTVLTIEAGIPVLVENLKITGGYAESNGGGISSSVDYLTVNNCLITHCSATQKGGGIYNTGNIVLNNTNISECNAAEGGGVYVLDTTDSDTYNVYMHDGKISENTATSHGGGIYGGTYLYGIAYIPFGAGGVKQAGKNDIYLPSGNRLTLVQDAYSQRMPEGCSDGIIASLTPHAYMVLDSYGNYVFPNLTYVDTGTASGGYECLKFAVTDDNPADNYVYFLNYRFDGRFGKAVKAYTFDAGIDAINAMEESGSIQIAGNMSDTDLSSIHDALTGLYTDKNDEVLVTLDLTGAKGLTAINGQFDGCYNLKEIILPEGITSIVKIQDLPENCEKIHIPSTITSITEGAFSHCNADIVMNYAPSPGYTLKERASTTSTYSYYLGDGLYTVDETTLVSFSKKHSSTSCSVADGTERIAKCAFDYCTNLQRVTLPASLTEIDLNAFNGCTALTTVNFRGSEEQKAALFEHIAEGNDELKNATWNCNYTGS